MTVPAIDIDKIKIKISLEDEYIPLLETVISDTLIQLKIKLKPEYLDTEDETTGAFINHWAAEIAAGEFIEQYNLNSAVLGDADGFTVNDVKIEASGSFKLSGALAKDRLNKAWDSLKPYLIPEDGFYFKGVRY